jgi:choline dehydrogenase-like flavoprotein
MPRYESDICIVGGGITAAMLALKPELRPQLSITVVEAGKRLFDTQNRMAYRQRSIDYAENPWPGDFIEDQAAQGVISRTMAVGGSALHWGGTCNRFSEEDLRLKSMFGLYTDWPLGSSGISSGTTRPFQPAAARSAGRGTRRTRDGRQSPGCTRFAPGPPHGWSLSCRARRSFARKR